MLNDPQTNQERPRSHKHGFLFILLNIAVIAYIAWREFGNGEHPRAIAIRDLQFGWLLLAIACFAVMLFSETWKYAYLLRATGHDSPLRTGFNCAILGKYFDNITPAGFGGQPFQMRYLKQSGCSDGVSGSLPILGLLGLQFSFVLIALVVFIIGGSAFAGYLLTARFAVWLGLAAYSFIPVCIVLFAIAPKALIWVVAFFTKLLKKLHLIKDAESATQRAVDALTSYTDSVHYFSRQPKLIAVVFVFSLIFRLAMLCLPWFILRGFGAQIPFLDCFCQTTSIYALIALVPTPGNSGAAEASFYTVFSALSPGSVFWAMLVWRLLCYYSWLFFGAGYYISETIRENKAS